MPETELGEVEGANEAIDRPNRIIQTGIILDPDETLNYRIPGAPAIASRWITAVS
jgi:hypothetical protein